MSNVIVRGIGSTEPAIEDLRSIPEMTLEAVKLALADANLTYEDIDAVVTASLDLLDGLTASNIAVTEVVGAVMKPETRIAADSLSSTIHASMQILAGAYKTVLVVAHAKPSMSNYDDITLWAMDPVHMQSLGLDFRSCSGLQAAIISQSDTEAVSRWTDVAVMRRSQAGGDTVSVEDIAHSPIIASPLRREMVAPFRDGAVAIVLQTEDQNENDPASIRISGLGYDLDHHELGDRDLTQWKGLERACSRAYIMAGIDDPSTAFDVVEPSCIYPHEEELFCAASGIGADTTVSPNGGTFAGYIPIAAGLSRLVEIVKSMRSDENCSRGLAHGAWGPAGQGQAVVVLERSKS